MHDCAGIIILLFEKAVDEPKFCPIYAGVCRRLSDQGPNFEEPDLSATAADGSAPRKPPTFLKLLLRKCQDEFENRSRAEKLALSTESLCRRDVSLALRCAHHPPWPSWRSL